MEEKTLKGLTLFIAWSIGTVAFLLLNYGIGWLVSITTDQTTYSYSAVRFVGLIIHLCSHIWIGLGLIIIAGLMLFKAALAIGDLFIWLFTGKK